MVKRPEPNLHFRLMFFTYKFRDFFVPRMKILKEAGIEEGFQVLDYGCGTGSYIAPLSDLVGPSGKIYALDIHPLAVQTVKRRATIRKLTNVETIQSDCQTALPDQSVDVALLYDVFHDLDNPKEVVRELHRILKPNRIPSFSDHHLKEDDVVSRLTGEGLFRLARHLRKDKRLFWHIDYLLRKATIEEVWINHDSFDECRIVGSKGYTLYTKPFNFCQIILPTRAVYFSDGLLAQIFSREVFALLLKEELVSQALVEKIMGWRHSGFSVHNRIFFMIFSLPRRRGLGDLRLLWRRERFCRHLPALSSRP